MEKKGANALEMAAQEDEEREKAEEAAQDVSISQFQKNSK